MTEIVLRLYSQELQNPDLDIRYLLPDLLCERSGGILTDDGYDYGENTDYLLLFLKASDDQRGLDCVLDVVKNVKVLENDLRTVVVAVKRDHGFEVIYPSDFHGSFPQ